MEGSEGVVVLQPYRLRPAAGIQALAEQAQFYTRDPRLERYSELVCRV